MPCHPVRVRIALPLLFAVFAALAPAVQPDFGSDPWKLVHPKATWILGVDWARARHSAAAQALSKQFAGAQSRVEAAGLGLDAVTSLDRVIASGISTEFREGANPAGMVVAVEGTIDRVRLKKGMPPGTAVERFKGVDLFVPPKAKPDEPLLALAGSRLLLIGDRASLALLLDGKGGVGDPELYGKAARLAADTELWLVAKVPEPQGGSAAADPLAAVRSVEMSVSLQKGLGLKGAFTADTPEAAQHLAGVARFAGAFGSDSAVWLRNLKLNVRGNTVSFGLDVPEAELEKGIVTAKTAIQDAVRQTLESFPGAQDRPLPGVRPAVRGVSGDVAVRLPKAEQTPKTMTIRIFGAEGGPKEIHYTTGGLKTP